MTSRLQVTIPKAVADRYGEADEMLTTFGVLYPDDSVARTALRGAAVYGLSWFDAHCGRTPRSTGSRTVDPLP